MRVRRPVLSVILVLCLFGAPLAAEAQQVPKPLVVALVVSASTLSELVGPDPIHPWARVFVHSLRDPGWVDGRNIVIERHSEGGGPELVRATFADLAARNVAAIVVSGGPRWCGRPSERPPRSRSS